MTFGVPGQPATMIESNLGFPKVSEMARPIGITIIASLNFFAAVVSLFFAIASFFIVLGVPVLFAYALVQHLCFFLLAGLLAANGIGLLRVRNWARLLTIVLTGFSLLSVPLAAFGDLMHFRSGMLIGHLFKGCIDGAILLYLFKPHVKQAFGATGF